MAGDRLLWIRAGDAAAAARRGVHASGAAIGHHRVPRGNRRHPVSVVRRVFDRGDSRGRHRPCRGGQSACQRRGASAGAGVGAAAQGGALSGAAAVARIRPRIEDHTGGGGRAVSDPAVDLLRRLDGRAETDLVGDGGGDAALSDPVQGGAAGRGAVDPHRLPHRPRDLLHRGVSGRNDHLDRRPRPSAGDGGADLSGCRHVRAADHDFAAGSYSQRTAAGACGRICCAGFRKSDIARSSLRA